MHTGGAFWCDGLGIAAADINQVIPSAVSCFNANGHQMLSIGQIADCGVANVVVSQGTGLTRPGWHYPQCALVPGLGDDPLVIRRNRFGAAFADAYGRRTV